jgi:GNAT superfamily N-acetyltransferase
VIRAFVEGDIPAAMRLKEAAGWNQVEQDWLTVIALAPRGCWVWEEHGRVVGTVTAISYGRKLAWIGMMLVDPQFRRRGIGRSLMEHAVAYLDGAGVETIKLDATDMGYPLYRGLGFQDECPVERWSGIAGPVSLESQSWDIRPVVGVDDVATLDQEAFGVSRTEVLRSLLPGCWQECFRTPDGYVMARPGSNAHYLGPCVARDREHARMLIEMVLSKHCGELMFWDVLPGNELAVQLAEGFGFTCARKLRRMWRPGVGEGSEIAANLAMQFAVAGFEFG